MSHDPKPTLVRLGALGDMVMFLPVLEAAHRRWGGAFDVITEGAWAPGILAHSPHVNAIWMMKGTQRRPLALSVNKRRTVAFLKQRASRPVMAFEKYHKLDDVLAAAGIAPQRCAEACDLERLEGEHQIDHHLRLLRTAWTDAGLRSGNRATDGIPRLDPAPELISDAKRWLMSRGLAGRRLILVQPGNKRTMRRGSLTRSSNSKYWPVERWTALVNAMTERERDSVALICGVPREQALARQIARGCESGRAVAVADDLPVSRLIALCRLAHSMVSVDTGPAHVAAAVGCPLVVMFGRADPRIYQPRGRAAVAVMTPWGDADSGPDDFCQMLKHPMLMLSVGQVLRQWSRVVVASRPERENRVSEHVADPPKSFRSGAD